jgi:hypothetical protein
LNPRDELVSEQDGEMTNQLFAPQGGVHLRHFEKDLKSRTKIYWTVYIMFLQGLPSLTEMDRLMKLKSRVFGTSI